jgi:hypothetical protein
MALPWARVLGGVCITGKLEMSEVLLIHHSEGQLRYAIDKWQKAEPAQGKIHLSRSLPARPAPGVISNAGTERYSAPTQHGAPLDGGVGTSGHQQMWLATSSIGVGQGSMASAYV